MNSSLQIDQTTSSTENLMDEVCRKEGIYYVEKNSSTHCFIWSFTRWLQ